MKRITIDPITRLEGHGKIEIFVGDDGQVADTYFQIPELRGFEKFSQGRPVEELPRITTRICGVCPEAHHMAGVKAADAVYNVEPPPAGRKLRELMYSTFYVADHTVHFYILAGPDFVCGPKAPVAERNILGLIQKVGIDAGKRVIGTRRKAQEIIQMLGGKAIHQVTAFPGGVSRGINEEERQQIEEVAKDFVEFGEFTLEVFNDVVLGNPDYVDLVMSPTFRHETYYLGLMDDNNCPNFYDGKVRVVDPEGKEVAKFEPKDYLDHIVEHVEPWTYLKYPYLKSVGWKGLVDGADSGVYRSAPLARLNAADGMATPKAQAAYEKMYDTVGGKPCHQTLAYHWARVIEIQYAAERMLELAQDPDITSDDFRTVPTETPTEGVGCVEAPRGLLLHHYKTDEKGVVTDANLVVGTTNNYAPITLSIKKAAQDLVSGNGDVDEGTLNMVEMAFRAYDPCFGCATHNFGEGSPLEINIRRTDGSLIHSTRR
ncbi:MAG: Ni/Fe hydrogenase subunit alpha [Armatimonadia bacterium]|nr:Ni/Fe hydrogenase subunit alpha [Armatimonadia bacterium]